MFHIMCEGGGNIYLSMGVRGPWFGGQESVMMERLMEESC